MPRLLNDRSSPILVGLVAALLAVLILAHVSAPAHAATAAADTQVSVAPFLQALVTAAGSALLAILSAAVVVIVQLAKQRFGIKNDVDIRNAMLQIADDAIRYGEGFAQQKVQSAAPLDTGNPVFAAALRFFQAHAVDELSHFNLDQTDAMRIVIAAYGRIADANTCAGTAPPARLAGARA